MFASTKFILTQRVPPEGPAPPSTLYFLNANADGEWNNLGNWYNDPLGSVVASRLPTAADSVVAYGTIATNSGSTPIVVNFTMNDESGDGFYLSIEIVTGSATFNGASSNRNTIYGDATFNDNSYNNYGAIYGNATFNDSSYMSFGGVFGNALFNDSSYNNNGLVEGIATFTGSACNDGGTAGTFVPDPPPSCSAPA